MSPIKIDENFVNATHSIGIPIGGIGTGYSVFGKYGFTKINFDSTPNEESKNYPHVPEYTWSYTIEPVADAPFAFVLQESHKEVLLQEKTLMWREDAEVMDKVSCYAYLPKAHFIFEKARLGLSINMGAFSPIISHDLANSTIPVQVFRFTINNDSDRKRRLKLKLVQNDRMKAAGDMGIYSDKHGQVAFCCVGGQANFDGVYQELTLLPAEMATVTYFIAWHYPYFKTFSPDLTEHFKRYYTLNYPDVISVIQKAKQLVTEWDKAIDDWHDSIQVPSYFKRLWFSSLSSTICSTMMSDDPYFFEIETPHPHIGTMDVNIYSSWLYIINWPELEKMEMNQFVDTVNTEGDKAGFIWHSLWNDPLEYTEEANFILRIYRDFLWYNDVAWLENAYPKMLASVNYIYNQGHYGHLIVSDHGNQSFDTWPMPGVSSYVNSGWVFALYCMERISKILGKETEIGDIPIGQFRNNAAKEYNDLLWNETGGYWNLFYRTPNAQDKSIPESIFTDQLFGKWTILLDRNSSDVLPQNKVKSALHNIYVHNMVEDNKTGFKGWVNGLLPGRKLDPSSYVTKVFWFCPQNNLGLLLGSMGEEDKALEVFQSIEFSLFNHHLAVGEYNGAIDKQFNVITSPEEPGKDTPRFPPYPRYKCCWESLICILGLKIDENNLYLNPFRTIDFSIRNIKIAGTILTINVESDWTESMVDGKKVSGQVQLDRKKKSFEVCFLK